MTLTDSDGWHPGPRITGSISLNKAPLCGVSHLTYSVMAACVHWEILFLILTLIYHLNIISICAYLIFINV